MSAVIIPAPAIPAIPAIPTPVAPIPNIDVTIDSNATFTYTKCDKVGGGISNIWLVNNLTVHISPTNVLIGNNQYKIVNNWDDQSTVLPVRLTLDVQCNATICFNQQ